MTGHIELRPASMPLCGPADTIELINFGRGTGRHAERRRSQRTHLGGHDRRLTEEAGSDLGPAMVTLALEPYTRADLRAQLAACHIAETQFLELVKHYGKTTVELYMAELIDRFGKLPQATENLLKVIETKLNCRTAQIVKLRSRTSEVRA
mgnify:CR=1 FL=1